ncbi:MAG: VPLPA-CTERM sorting domain-containing protein [Chromatiales bacterium]|nr:VPLPA-CTERM sorting domain-containing protein [Chromatiales bacterium]
MRKLFAVAALALVSAGAHAATAKYELVSVTVTTPFGALCTENAVCDGPGAVLGDAGFMTLDIATGAVTGTAQWSVDFPNATYDYAGDWSTVLGSGVNLLKLDETCGGVNAPQNCVGPRGLQGDWISGELQDGTASDKSAVNVSVTGTTQIGIDTLTIFRSTEFFVCPAAGGFVCLDPAGDGSFPFNLQSIELNYVLVPVPAAVWLFGSALGLMAFLRRRRAS